MPVLTEQFDQVSVEPFGYLVEGLQRGIRLALLDQQKLVVMDADQTAERSEAHPALGALAMNARADDLGIFAERNHVPSLELVDRWLSAHSMTCHILRGQNDRGPC